MTQNTDIRSICIKSAYSKNIYIRDFYTKNIFIENTYVKDTNIKGTYLKTFYIEILTKNKNLISENYNCSLTNNFHKFGILSIKLLSKSKIPVSSILYL